MRRQRGTFQLRASFQPNLTYSMDFKHITTHFYILAEPVFRGFKGCFWQFFLIQLEDQKHWTSKTNCSNY